MSDWGTRRIRLLCEKYRDLFERVDPQANANRLQDFAREVAESVGFSASGGDV